MTDNKRDFVKDEHGNYVFRLDQVEIMDSFVEADKRRITRTQKNQKDVDKVINFIKSYNIPSYGLFDQRFYTELEDEYYDYLLNLLYPLEIEPTEKLEDREKQFFLDQVSFALLHSSEERSEYRYYYIARKGTRIMGFDTIKASKQNATMVSFDLMEKFLKRPSLHSFEFQRINDSEVLCVYTNFMDNKYYSFSAVMTPGDLYE